MGKSERLRIGESPNLAPRSADTPWYELHNIELPNAEPPLYANGDRVQAVQRVHLARSKPSLFSDPEQEKIRFEILKMVDREERENLKQHGGPTIRSEQEQQELQTSEAQEYLESLPPCTR